MYKYFRFVIVLIFIILMSCGSKESSESQYDIYEVKVKTFLNIRATPSSKGKVIGYINNGTQIPVVNIVDGWAKIEDGKGNYGYVSADYLTLVHTYARQEDTYTQEDDASIHENIEDKNSNQKNISESVKATRNVNFIGDSSILTDPQKIFIENTLKNYEEYFFVISTVEKVETDELFSFAPDLLKDLSKKMNSGMSWWQRFKSTFTGNSPSSNLVLISYIKNAMLLQIECNGNSIKYLRMNRPDTYFAIQAEALKNLPGAIVKSGEEIAKSGEEFKSRNWYVKAQINSGSILDNICDDYIVQNILPNNSFWHKWVFGWIFALPLAIANLMFTLTGSYRVSILLFMIIILSLQYYIVNKLFSTKRSDKLIALGFMFIKFFLGLCMISILIYMTPDMTNIMVMAKSGFSNDVIKCAVEEYATTHISKNWFLILIFIVGTTLLLGIDKNDCIFATLPDKQQRYFFKTYKKDIESRHPNLDYDKYKDDDTLPPYSGIVSEKLGDEGGKILATTLPLSFLFSGTLLLYASVFIWTKVLNKAIFIIKGIMTFKKRGLYK